MRVKKVRNSQVLAHGYAAVCRMSVMFTYLFEQWKTCLKPYIQDELVGWWHGSCMHTKWGMAAESEPTGIESLLFSFVPAPAPTVALQCKFRLMGSLQHLYIVYAHKITIAKYLHPPKCVWMMKYICICVWRWCSRCLLSVRLVFWNYAEVTGFCTRIASSDAMWFK